MHPSVGGTTHTVELAPSFLKGMSILEEDETPPRVVMHGSKYEDSFVGICEVRLEGGGTGVVYAGFPDQDAAKDHNRTREVHAVGHASALATLCTHCLLMEAAGEVACSRCAEGSSPITPSPRPMPRPRDARGTTGGSPRRQRVAPTAWDAAKECTVLDAQRKIVAVPSRVREGDLTIASGTRTYYIAVCGNNWICGCGALKSACAASPRCACHHPRPNSLHHPVGSVFTTAQGYRRTMPTREAGVDGPGSRRPRPRHLPICVRSVVGEAA